MKSSLAKLSPHWRMTGTRWCRKKSCPFNDQTTREPGLRRPRTVSLIRNNRREILSWNFRWTRRKSAVLLRLVSFFLLQTSGKLFLRRFYLGSRHPPWCGDETGDGRKSRYEWWSSQSINQSIVRISRCVRTIKRSIETGMFKGFWQLIKQSFDEYNSGM